MGWNDRQARYALGVFLILFLSAVVDNHFNNPVYPDPEAGRAVWPPGVHILDASPVQNLALKGFEQGTTIADAVRKLGLEVDRKGSEAMLPRAGVLYRSSMGWTVRCMTQRERWIWRIPMDIHRCTPEDLQRITGIGPVLALKISNYVRRKGRLNSLNDLAGVPGVGPGKLKALKGELEIR